MARNGRQAAVVLLLILAAAAAATPAQGKVVFQKWHVNYALWSPDCVETMVIAVNGATPGPEIRATVGDTVIINVTNHIPTEGLLIHWHGIHQTGTPWADGAAYVSQCPIMPKEEFTYKFTVDHSGTFFWHGHFGMQRQMGLYGWFIVDPAPEETVPFSYDGELKIILNDWWHRSVFEHTLRLLDNPFGWVGEPQSLLMEGRGQYNCTKVPESDVSSSDNPKCNAAHPQCSHYILQVEPGKRYRLRIASVASLSSLNFILEDHPFTVVEADGNYIDPVDMKDIDVYSGETYSVLFTANQSSSGNYWAVSNVRGRKPKTSPGLAILNYQGNQATKPNTSVPESPKWDNTTYSVEKARGYVARHGFGDPLPHGDSYRRSMYVAKDGFGDPIPLGPPDRRLNLLSKQNLYNNVTKWAINNISFEVPVTAALPALKFCLVDPHTEHPPDEYDPTYDIYSVPANPNTTMGSGFFGFNVTDTVDIVLQNSNMLEQHRSDVHPWHLHGHDFWIMGYGIGKFNFTADYGLLNHVNPPSRNTAPVFPFGWTYLRFVASNPGAWLFHCHLEAHVHMGMSVLFVVGEDEIRNMDIPVGTLGCGETKGRPNKCKAISSSDAKATPGMVMLSMVTLSMSFMYSKLGL